MKVATAIFSLCLFLVQGSIFAQQIPEPLQPPRLVNDFVGLLNENEWASLEQKLRNYHDTTSTQIYVVIVNSLQGYDIADFTFRIGEKWGVGQKGKNNGVIILVKNRVGNQMGEVFIATGYGLEDVIPDAVANRIINNEIVPNFKEGNYFKGLNVATTRIFELASGKYEATSIFQSYSLFVWLFVTFMIAIFFFVFLTVSNALKYRKQGVLFGSSLSTLSGSKTSGGYGTFSSGSGSFGGFSGGGGGSFGGGGARGSW